MKKGIKDIFPIPGDMAQLIQSIHFSTNPEQIFWVLPMQTHNELVRSPDFKELCQRIQKDWDCETGVASEEYSKAPSIDGTKECLIVFEAKKFEHSGEIENLFEEFESENGLNTREGTSISDYYGVFRDNWSERSTKEDLLHHMYYLSNLQSLLARIAIEVYREQR